MAKSIIRIENLSKSYQLGEISTGVFFRDVKRWWARQRGKPDPYLKIGEIDHGNRQGETVWALRDVSFSIQQGDAVGIIGRNGAGKSTLLKILSRVTAPTNGVVKVKGRIASLLEVGTGFHPELTGRENIFLNGAIMGMNRAEVNRKFDEIVDFAGVDRFIDTPVKRYSSGMYVRLAFAVAAHLEPEILVVDEVLAVGDAEFQKKCLGKMGEVTKGGRTVLFVSHNMGAIAQLCNVGIWLDKGELQDILPVDQTIQRYLQSGAMSTPSAVFTHDDRRPAQYLSATIERFDGSVATEISCSEPFLVKLVYIIRKIIPGLYLTFYFRGSNGSPVLFSDIMDCTSDLASQLTEGTHVFKIRIPKRLLAPDTYTLTVGSASYGEHIDHHNNICSFTIQEFETRRHTRPGAIGLRLKWEHRLETDEEHSANPPQALEKDDTSELEQFCE